MTMELPKNEIPPTIDWLSNAQILDFLGICESQYRRDLSLLEEIGLVVRDNYCKGHDRHTIQVLSEFRILVKERGRKDAAREIFERYNNDHN